MNFARLLLCVLVASTFVASDVMAKGKEKKIGFVDLSGLFDNYYKTKDFDESLEKEHNSFQEERNAKIEEIRDKQGKLALLKEEEKVRVEEELEKLKAALLEFDRQKRTDLTRRRDEKVREILLEIEKIVSDYAKKEKYDMILNDRVLIFGNESYDLTEIILKQLNGSK